MLPANRRQFLAIAAASTVLAQQSVQGQETASQANAKPAYASRYLARPAIAAYSLRQHFSWSRGKTQKPKSPAIDMFGFIDFCAEQDAAAELTSYFFAPDVSDSELLDLKRHAFRSGVAICGTSIGNRFDERTGAELEKDIVDAERWIDRAALLGASHIRFFAGKAATLADPVRFQRSVDSVRRCAKLAADRGVMIGIENHGGITAETLLRFLDEVDSDWVGINLDTGNFPTNPYKQLAACVERAVHVQWKVAIRNEAGQKEPADFARFAQILRDGKYSGYVALEYEENGDAFEETEAAYKQMKSALQAPA